MMTASAISSCMLTPADCVWWKRCSPGSACQRSAKSCAALIRCSVACHCSEVHGWQTSLNSPRSGSVTLSGRTGECCLKALIAVRHCVSGYADEDRCLGLMEALVEKYCSGNRTTFVARNNQAKKPTHLLIICNDPVKTCTC